MSSLPHFALILQMVAFKHFEILRSSHLCKSVKEGYSIMLHYLDCWHHARTIVYVTAYLLMNLPENSETSIRTCTHTHALTHTYKNVL